jgi:hypothetical protein
MIDFDEISSLRRPTYDASHRPDRDDEVGTSDPARVRHEGV